MKKIASELLKIAKSLAAEDFVDREAAKKSVAHLEQAEEKFTYAVGVLDDVSKQGKAGDYKKAQHAWNIIVKDVINHIQAAKNEWVW